MGRFSKTAVPPRNEPSRNSALCSDVSNRSQWPIVYHENYNIRFLGMQKLHPFDSEKWGRVFQFLIGPRFEVVPNQGITPIGSHNVCRSCRVTQNKPIYFIRDSKLITRESTVVPVEPSEDDLKVVHSQAYLDSLKWSASVAQITEILPVAIIPNFIVQAKVLRPLRLQTGGSIIAGQLAFHRGWAVNIGGGFHHCSAEQGGGFCAYADITLLIKFAMSKFKISRVMIIDLDAHQGNGYARDFMDDDRVYVLDMFNRNIYPHDGFAKRGINRKVELPCGATDPEYLPLVREHVHAALDEFRPEFVVYNAGTDVLAGDSLGLMAISPAGVIKRDGIVFAAVRGRSIPMVMLTSGGYQRSNARVIADSILSLHENGLIEPPR